MTGVLVAQNGALSTYQDAMEPRYRDPLGVVARLVDRALSERGPGADLAPVRRITATVGREQVLERLVTGLEDVPVAAIAGLPGIGKTTLVHELARKWSGPAIYASVASAALHDGGDGGLGPAASAGVLERSWARLDRIGGLLVLDDFHLVGERDRRAVLESAAHALVSGRLVVGTRERISAANDAVHLQFKLDGIDRASAELLWKRWSDGCATAHCFEAAWQYSGGNPLA